MQTLRPNKTSMSTNVERKTRAKTTLPFVKLMVPLSCYAIVSWLFHCFTGLYSGGLISHNQSICSGLISFRLISWRTGVELLQASFLN